MLFRLDPTSPVGLADQIAAQVRGALADGSLAPGQRLPPAREVAAGLDINMHTVLRAYARLRDEGLLDLRRGRGASVREGTPSAVRDSADLAVQIEGLVAAATRLGLSRDDLIDQIRRAHP